MQCDKCETTRLLKTARGQIDGIIKMVEDDRYCLDISHQIMATQAVLKKVNKEILAGHLKHCVGEAKTQEELEEKTDELVKLIDQLLK